VPAFAQLQITITNPSIEPCPSPSRLHGGTGGAEGLARDIAGVVSADLVGTGLFREIPDRPSSTRTCPSGRRPPSRLDRDQRRGADHRAVAVQGDQLIVKFRLYDVFSGAELGEGLQFAGTAAGWRRMGHKVADAVYSRITGEGGYFDSRVVFVSESGPKEARRSGSPSWTTTGRGCRS
jgi:TolB protein